MMTTLLFFTFSFIVSFAREGNVFITEPGNSCPNGTQKLMTAAECRAGSRLAGITGDSYNGEENERNWPSGCYFCNDADECAHNNQTTGFWFNKHTTGSANGTAQPYCSDGYLPITKGEMLLVGDSDIDYWFNWSAVFEDANNVGFGGYTCREVEDEVQLFIETFQPSVVVLVCGENAISWGYNVSSTFEVFRNVVDQYISGGAKVIYIGTKPEPDTTDLHDEYREYDNLIWNLAANMSGNGEPSFVMIDSYGGFEALGNPESLYANDSLHLSAEGYQLWTEWVNLAFYNTNCFVWRSGVCVDGEDPVCGFGCMSGASSVSPVALYVLGFCVLHLVVNW